MFGTKRMLEATLAVLAALAVIMAPIVSSASLIYGSSRGVVATWKHLGQPHPIFPYGTSAVYYRTVLSNHSTLNVVLVDLKSRHWRLRTVVNYGLINVAATARCFAASIAVNGGFFDTRSGKALGFVVDQQRTLNTPVLNPSLKRFSKKIINRSEFREIDLKDGSQQFTIAPHDAPLPADALLQESLQAGPQLLPDYNPGLEAFKRPGRNGHLVDVINTSLPENRTAIGITADDKLIIVTVSNAALGPDSAGATLLQLADILESLGAVHALNLDGGSSTTMYLRLADSGKKSHEYGVPKAAHMRLVSTVLLLQPH